MSWIKYFYVCSDKLEQWAYMCEVQPTFAINKLYDYVTHKSPVIMLIESPPFLDLL